MESAKILIGTSAINRMAGVSISTEVMNRALKSLGVQEVGVDANGRPLYSSDEVSAITEKIKSTVDLPLVGQDNKTVPLNFETVRDIVRDEISRALSGLSISVEINQETVEAAVGAAMSIATAEIKRYLDTSLDQFDGELSRIHQCAQQGARISAEANNGVKAVREDLTRAVTNVSELQKLVDADQRMIRKEMNNTKEFSLIKEEIALLRLEIREISKRR